MKYVTALGFILLFQLTVTAQADTIFYFDKDGSVCSKRLATSYQKVKLVDSVTQRYSFEEYTIGDTLQARGFFLRDAFRSRIGSYTEYFKNGNRRVKGTYLTDATKNMFGKQVNRWYWWYENGSIRLEKLYALDTTTNLFNSYIVNFWDTAGVKKVEEGNGEYLFTEEWCGDSLSKETLTFIGGVKYGKLDGQWKGFYADGTLLC